MDPTRGHVTVVQNHRTGHVVLAGDFVELIDSDRLGQGVAHLLADPPETVVVNLAKVGMMCSSAVTMLVELRNACDRSGSEFVISSSSAAMLRTLDVAGLATTSASPPHATATDERHGSPARASSRRPVAHCITVTGRPPPAPASRRPPPAMPTKSDRHHTGRSR